MWLEEDALAREASFVFARRMLMLYWALVFFLIAVVAAVLGFGGIAVAFAGVARILFFLFVVVFLVSLLMGLTRHGPV
jgi:uncharacterized membrane protein YtjA (UPF0391 family)